MEWQHGDQGELEIDEFPAPHRSMRVAIVTETYPPEVNGVSMTLARLVEGLRMRHHDVQLVRPRQSGGDAGQREERFHEVLMRGLPIPRYGHLRMGVPSKRSLVRLWALRRPDVVHIATEGPLGWSALQACRHLQLPVTSDFRTNFHAYSRHYGVGWLRKPIMAYLRKFHNATLRTMVPTEALRRDLAACGFRGLRVVARGVDTEHFHPLRRDRALRASWGADDGTLVVVCVGRLAPEKNLDLVVRAFDAVSRVVPDSRLVLVGDGPMREALRARCPQAVLAGQRSGADLAAHYASADLFVFASMTETFGNVVTEAMASGLPVLAFEHAAAAQLIRHGQDGLLAALGDEAAFLGEAVRAVGDRSRLARIGAAARDSAGALGWAGVVERFEDELRAVVRAAKPSEGVLPTGSASAPPEQRDRDWPLPAASSRARCPPETCAAPRAAAPSDRRRQRRR